MSRPTPQRETRRIAYFVTPHGYGHASRAAAVMAALLELDESIRFEIFTQVPEWFFESSLGESFGYHPLLTDIGLAQKTALVEDIPETMRRLDAFLPFDGAKIEQLARWLSKLDCQLVLCDIAPMGIVVAREAGIPSVLIENFTWDWIYEEYVSDDGRMKRHVAYLAEIFNAADYRIQTEPLCRQRPADLTTAPVSRRSRTSRRQIRQELGIPERAKAILVTMGGTPWRNPFLHNLADRAGVCLIVPGADGEQGLGNGRVNTHDNLVLLPHHSHFFHPDLVNASDAAIGKVGYSTVSEVYWSGVPFGYVARRKFRESAPLVRYIGDVLPGLAITEAQIEDGSWISLLPDLLALPRISRQGANGADEVARFIGELLGVVSQAGEWLL